MWVINKKRFEEWDLLFNFLYAHHDEFEKDGTMPKRNEKLQELWQEIRLWVPDDF